MHAYDRVFFMFVVGCHT